MDPTDLSCNLLSKCALHIDTPLTYPLSTLVDLPGLIHSATKASSEEDKRLIFDLVGEYKQNDRTIILAVVSAKNDAANQIISTSSRSTIQLAHEPSVSSPSPIA